MIGMARTLVAVGLWLLAAFLAIAAVLTQYPDPCDPATDLEGWVLVLGMVLVAGIAAFVTTAGSVRNVLVAFLVSVGVSAVTGFALFFLLLSIWVSHCTN
jgi:hypothetical protein